MRHSFSSCYNITVGPVFIIHSGHKIFIRLLPPSVPMPSRWRTNRPARHLLCRNSRRNLACDTGRRQMVEKQCCEINDGNYTSYFVIRVLLAGIDSNVSNFKKPSNTAQQTNSTAKWRRHISFDSFDIS